MSSDERVHRTKKWNMWIGSQSDLREILRILDEQSRPLAASFVEDATRFEREQVEWTTRHLERRNAQVSAEDSDNSDDASDSLMLRELQRLTAFHERAIAKAENDMLIEADILLRSDERRTVTMDADGLARYLEDKSPLRLELSAPKSNLLDYKVKLAFDVVEGVSLSVSSIDAAWVSATYSDLQEAITRKAPRWSALMRSRLISVPVFTASFATALYFLLDKTGDAIGNAEVSGWLGVAYFPLVFIVVVLAVAIYERHVKAFEVLRLGQKGSLRAVLGLLGSSFVALLIGLLVNYLS